MKKSTTLNRKEIFWHHIAGDFPDMTMKQAFKETAKACIDRGLMELPPKQWMTEAEITKFRSKFIAKRSKVRD